MRVFRAVAPVVVLVVTATALAWLSAAFHGVALTMDGGGPCQRLLPGVQGRLDHVARGPLLLLAACLVASAACAAVEAHRRLPRRAAWHATAVLGLSAVVGAEGCREAYAPADGYSVLGIMAYGLLAAAAAAVLLIAVRATVPRPRRRRILAAIWAVAVVHVAVLPFVVAQLTPTGQFLVC